MRLLECDYCGERFEGASEALSLSVPPQYQPVNDDGEAQEYADLDLCSWACLRDLGAHFAPEEEKVPEEVPEPTGRLKPTNDWKQPDSKVLDVDVR